MPLDDQCLLFIQFKTKWNGIGEIRTLTVQIKSLLCCRYTTTPPRRLWDSIALKLPSQISDVMCSTPMPGIVCNIGLCVFVRGGSSGVTAAGDAAGHWSVDRRRSCCLIDRMTGSSLSLIPLLTFGLKFVVGAGGVPACSPKKTQAGGYEFAPNIVFDRTGVRTRICAVTARRTDAGTAATLQFQWLADRLCGISAVLPNRSNWYGVTGNDRDRASTLVSGLTIVFFEDNLFGMNNSRILNLSLLLLPT